MESTKATFLQLWGVLLWGIGFPIQAVFKQKLTVLCDQGTDVFRELNWGFVLSMF